MVRCLVLVSSLEGQTARIGRRIAEHLQKGGTAVALRDAARPGAGEHLAAYEGVVVGGAIHYGHHAPLLREIVASHRAILATRHSAFFSVSLSGGGPARDDELARRYIEEFTIATGWKPDQSASFAGAVRNSKYGFVKALMVRLTLARRGATPTGDHEYTDWEAVEAFAQSFAGLLATPRR